VRAVIDWLYSLNSGPVPGQAKSQAKILPNDRDLGHGGMRRRTLAEQQPPMHGSKQVHELFSVVGWKPEGRAIELVVAKSKAQAEDYAVRELGFVKVDNTSLVSNSVHVIV
jgi:hypothetical protein